MSNPAYLAIGGAMELTSDSPLVEAIVKYSGGKQGKIVILPTASSHGHEVGQLYLEVFSEFCDSVSYHVIDTREDAHDQEVIEDIETASGLFFTGGDQLKITSLLGGSPIMSIVREAQQRSIFVAGTSAGAAAMPDTMITYGPADSMLKGNLKMSPGIGLVSHMVIDSHFVKRGRISRLLHLVSTNPGTMGVGLSEDTGILIYPNKDYFEVVGSRQVVLVDGRRSRHANIASIRDQQPFSVTDVKVHVLGPKYGYDYREHEIRIPTDDQYSDHMKVPREVAEMPYRPLNDHDW
ncbi:MAG: cyanophycinase [Candidatus Kariarchaeaceae archaeon]